MYTYVNVCNWIPVNLYTSLHMYMHQLTSVVTTNVQLHSFALYKVLGEQLTVSIDVCGSGRSTRRELTRESGT